MKLLKILAILLLTNGSLAHAFGSSDITNISFKPSVDRGKKGKSYAVVKAKDGEPAIGERSYKFVLLPFDCGSNDGYSDCGYKYDADGGGGDRARSELSSSSRGSFGKGEHWFSFSVYLPEDYQNIYPTITSFFQVYGGKRPSLKIENFYDILVANVMPGGRSAQKIVLTDIDDMRGKWTHFMIHANISHEGDGFYKFWMNGKQLSTKYSGRTVLKANGTYVKAGLYQTGISRYLAHIGENPKWKKRQSTKTFPTQIIYMDNIFKAKSREKLLELIDKAK